MNIEDLIDLIDNNHKNKKALEYLLIAITDWPIQVNSVEEYFLSVNSFLNIHRTNINQIKNQIKKIDFIKFTWEAESINTLIIFLENYETDDLNILI
jgi:hypothetical protein